MECIYFKWENGLSARSLYPKAVKHLWEKYGAPSKCEVLFVPTDNKKMNRG
ncbi:MAG: hypothetical protein ACMUIP_17465 [bacterium]